MSDIAGAVATTPKLFISYSWTTPEHKSWVLKLAEDLTDSGVHVIIDEWDLREGQEANAFMEQMVSDPTVTKVAMICDKAYVDKANGRKGGVGTETQIITPQIMNSHQQTKYVAVVTEHDEQGKPIVPVYFGSRIFLDFTDPSDHAVAFEKLVRWIFDKPVNTRPALGKAPAFLAANEGTARLATSPLQRRAIDGLKNSKPHALPALREFLDGTVAEFENLRLGKGLDPFDEAVYGSIKAFVPYRNELVDVFVTVATYRNDPEAWKLIHRFFERLIPYMDLPQGFSGTYSEWDFDNYRFIIKELFLYVIATTVKYECFEGLGSLTGASYLVTRSMRPSDNPMRDFQVFQDRMRSLDMRNQRLKLNRISLVADLLKEGVTGTAISFSDIMAADFVLYLKSRIVDRTTFYWYPHTLVYMFRAERHIALFSRCYSKAYFDRVKEAIGVADAAALKAVANAIDQDERMLPNFDYSRLRVGAVIDLDRIATMP